jgi:integrase
LTTLRRNLAAFARTILRACAEEHCSPPRRGSPDEIATGSNIGGIFESPEKKVAGTAPADYRRERSGTCTAYLLNRNPADAVDPPKVDWVPMQTYDISQPAELIEAVRGTSMLMPALLAVLCGLRRGAVAALRWRSVDLASGQMSIVESAEQTKAGIRCKSPKSGKGRTVALSQTRFNLKRGPT